MKEPLTEELLQELLDAPNPQVFAEKHSLQNQTLSQYLQQLLYDRNLERIDVIHAANLNETFGYQIFVGTRKASRDKILQIAFAMRLSLKEANRLLNVAGASSLYCKNRRDAIIIFCLTHECTLQEANEELYRFGEKTIC